MKKMGIAVGSLILLGFLLLQVGVIFKMIGINLLHPIFEIPSNFFIVANTCFLVALIVDRFDVKKEEQEARD